jgi:hypothetical protein
LPGLVKGEETIVDAHAIKHPRFVAKGLGWPPSQYGGLV